MSLLLEVVRQLLEYLGFPPDRLVLIWENYTSRRNILRLIVNRLPATLFQGKDIQSLHVLKKNYGWTRSVVRIIGSLLPLEPCPRPHFQNILGPGSVQCDGKEIVYKPEIPSLADAPFLMDDVTSYTRFRHHLPLYMPADDLTRPDVKSSTFSPINQNCRDLSMVHEAQSENAIQKIAALEEELMQLRQQIAAIVAMQESKSIQSCSETICSFGSPCNALPPPSLTSTPINAQPLQSIPAPPPPPPPLPPLIPAAKIDSAKATLDLIKQRKAAHKQSPKDSNVEERNNVNILPSMMDVLKDMNSVRLRVVERSPGGTPLTRKDKKRRSLNDPAAIIAHALKKKFAHRHNDDSLDKENRSHEESPFSSPEFGRHLLKPAVKRPLKEMTRKQVFGKPGAHV
ncbi:mitochondrial fission regulator 2 isoform X2 [Hyperolius riggenbachi]|uniref:mitochondrial fission regulator 2 isoform X2 n=1 Tax=Hyperolius riggenbachi TaxID=752182 RepID=UPI0035A2E152